MKAFKFELQEILDIRVFEQQQAENELVKALAVENEIQQKLDNLALQKVTVQKQMKGSTDFIDISNASRFYDFIRIQSEYLMNEMAEAKLVTEQKREFLKKAMQKTNSLEDLKKSLHAEYKIACQKEEDEEIDDIVTSKMSVKNCSSI